MRKHNEGYSLVLVLVVLVVICLVATFILSFSLSNLQNQQRSVKLMQEKYQAMGEVEKYVAKIETIINESQPEADNTFNLTEENLSAGELDLELDYQDKSIQIVAQSGTTEIRYEIIFIADSVKKEADVYELTNCTGIACKSYEINRGVAPQ